MKAVEAYFEEFDELWDVHESIAGLDFNALISSVQMRKKYRHT